jgi:endo-1,4-beta-xylanase
LQHAADCRCRNRNRAETMLSRRRALNLAGTTAVGAFAAGVLRPHAARAAGGLRPGRIPYGACVRPVPLQQEIDYRTAIQTYCQELTPEGGLFWGYLRPARDQFKFDFADGILAFCEANEMTMRGHTLVWYGAMPDWTKSISTAAEAERELTTHIERVVGRYRGKIKTWHVVNEPIDDSKGEVPGLRPSVWLDNLGDRYIDIAFRTAHAVDPAAELVINEYDIECLDGTSSKRREAYLKLIRDLVARGVPLHGVGLQGHIKGKYAIDRDGVHDFVTAVRALGLKVHVTELDVIDYDLPGAIAVRDAMVASRAYDFLDAISAAARPSVIATWGITDRYTWMPVWYKRKDGLPNRPLPLDADCKPKPLWNVIDYFCSR